MSKGSKKLEQKINSISSNSLPVYSFYMDIKNSKLSWSLRRLKFNELENIVNYIIDLEETLEKKQEILEDYGRQNGYVLFEDGREVYKTYREAFNESVLETHKLRKQIKELENQLAIQQKALEKYSIFEEPKLMAIQEIAKWNELLTDTIIEVTQNEFDFDKLCYLGKMTDDVRKFGEKIQEQIKKLRREEQHDNR